MTLNRNFTLSTIRSLPLILLFYLSLVETDLKFKYSELFSFNLEYIVIYFFVLKRPQLLGYGFIFLAGIINDVVLGNIMGISALTYLVIALTATYVKSVSVRATLLTDWVTFVIAVFFSNITYILTIKTFGDLSIDYIGLLSNSIFTIILYPVAWLVFILLWNQMRFKHA